MARFAGAPPVTLVTGWEDRLANQLYYFQGCFSSQCQCRSNAAAASGSHEFDQLRHAPAQIRDIITDPR
jgi:hypothetical protein